MAWAIDSDIYLRAIDYPHIFDHIKLIFREELYTSYYTPSSSYVTVNTKTNQKHRKQILPMGSLYNSWKYQITQVREEQKGLGKDVKKYYINKRDCGSEIKNFECPEPDEVLINLKKWLSHSFDPWSSVVENWKKNHFFENS